MFEDHLTALEADSKKVGTQGGDLDFALLVDGLAAEREQGITIDVAYRFFSTEQRKFIVADTPGHEQYTRNMVTGASTADAGGHPDRRPQGRAHPDPPAQLPRVAARHPQGRRSPSTSSTSSTTRRRSSTQIEADYRAFAGRDRARRHRLHPDVGAAGRQHHRAAAPTRPGTTGRRCIGYLETVEIAGEPRTTGPFRMPVQWVNRPDLDFRGFSGVIVGGRVRPGDRGAGRAVGPARARSRAS